MLLGWRAVVVAEVVVVRKVVVVGWVEESLGVSHTGLEGAVRGVEMTE